MRTSGDQMSKIFTSNIFRLEEVLKCTIMETCQINLYKYKIQRFFSSFNGKPRSGLEEEGL